MSAQQYRELTAADGNFIEGDEFLGIQGGKDWQKVGPHYGYTYPGGPIGAWTSGGTLRARRPIPNADEGATLLEWLQGVKGGLNSPNNTEGPHVWIEDCAGLHHWHADTYVGVLRKAKAEYVAPREGDEALHAAYAKDNEPGSTLGRVQRKAFFAGLALGRRGK